MVATNRKARAACTVEDTLEAGLALVGSEVKSLRAGNVQMADAYAFPRGGELFLSRSASHPTGQRWPSHTTRSAPEAPSCTAPKLDRWTARVRERGYSIVPLVALLQGWQASWSSWRWSGQDPPRIGEKTSEERETRREMDRALRRR